MKSYNLSLLVGFLKMYLLLGVPNKWLNTLFLTFQFSKAVILSMESMPLWRGRRGKGDQKPITILAGTHIHKEHTQYSFL